MKQILFLLLLLSPICTNLFAKVKRDESGQIIYVDTHDDYANASITIPMDIAKFKYFKTYPNEKNIALTFDCADVKIKNANDILDVLKKHNIKATFFIAGAFIYKNEDLGFNLNNLKLENFKTIKRMIDEGHDIGNHSTTHPHNATNINWKKELTTLEKGWSLILKIIYQDHGLVIPKNGFMKRMWRAPYGEYNDKSLTLAATAGYPFHFGWNIDTQDSFGRPNCETHTTSSDCWSGAKMTNQILKYLKLNKFELPTVVVLAHLSNAYLWGKSINGLERFIQVVSDNGYDFNTIPNLFKYPIPQINYY